MDQTSLRVDLYLKLNSSGFNIIQRIAGRKILKPGKNLVLDCRRVLVPAATFPERMPTSKLPISNIFNSDNIQFTFFNVTNA